MKSLTLELHPIEASILLTAIHARVEDLEAYRDTWSVSESVTLLGIAKRIPDTETRDHSADTSKMIKDAH